MAAELEGRIRSLGLEGLQWHVSLARLCTMRVGGPALAVFRPRGAKEARDALFRLREAEVPWRVIGRGSNILAPDSGFMGVLVVMGRDMGTVEFMDAERGLVRAAAGCSLARLLALASSCGLAGLEFAAGIPGSVGGAVVMNAGSGGGETAAALAEVEWMDGNGEVHREPPERLGFSYRSWGAAAGSVVLSALFSLRPGDADEIRADIRERLRRRGRSQPLGMPSFGSVFKNPPGDYAGRLIEAAGLKGVVRGGAMISDVHANFIVNRGHATAADVIWLMRTARDRVAERFGVVLEPEVHLLGGEAEMLCGEGK